MKMYTYTVPFTKRCGFFSTQICYEYRSQWRPERVVNNVSKTRIAQRCCQGFYKLDDTQCKPICSVPCTNGLCTAPETCTCLSGYHKNDQNVCVKNECDPSLDENGECVNGTCTTNGTCVCNAGFIKIEPSKCIPKCSEGCMNGNCVSPETCLCDVGYEAVNSSVCKPVCQNACMFGTCTRPEECSCFTGYELRSGTNHICDPVCMSGCSNGECVEPNLCICNNGFEFSELSRVCEPFCSEECVNANCTSPNTCTCEAGFVPTNATHCDILCENCTNGYCEEPNVCQCDIGYHMNEEKLCIQNECASNEMEDNCQNGYCSDGVCMCDSGYEKNATGTCSPICSLECINGYCSEPEVCQCYAGYDINLVNGTDDSNCTNCTSFTEWNVCRAICEDCKNGTCIEGVCSCNEGYSQHPRNRGKCVLNEDLIDLIKEM